MLSWFCMKHTFMFYFLELPSSLNAHFSFFKNSILFLFHGFNKFTYNRVDFWGWGVQRIFLPLPALSFFPSSPFLCLFWLLYLPLDPSFNFCFSLIVHVHFKSGHQNAYWASVGQGDCWLEGWSIKEPPFFSIRKVTQVVVSAFRSFLQGCWFSWEGFCLGL